MTDRPCRVHRVRRHVRRLGWWFLSLAATMAALPFATSAIAGSSAVVFMYHRFGESALPSTNTTMTQFEGHIRALASGGFTVLPLPEIVDAIRAGRDLPDRTVGLSVDDAFLSLYTNGWPKLKKAGLPFTLFVATDAVDREFRNYMSWDGIRELAAEGVTIGSQSASHPHMPRLTPEATAADLARSNQRFEQELGERPSLFAYPFGETSTAVRTVVKNAGFVAAFGQHSGVLYSGADYFYLPRFAMNEAHGNLDRFVLAANALPIAASDITPPDPLLTPRSNPPAFAFTVIGEPARNLDTMACYASGQGRTGLERRGQARIFVRVAKAFPPGRSRINCTMPTPEGRWRWFGMQFYVPSP